VCGGLGMHFGLSPLLFRALFAVLSIAGGISIPLYLLLWIAVPDSREVFGEEEARLSRETVDAGSDTKRLYDASEQPGDPAMRSASDALVLVGVVFVGVGLSLLLRNLGLLRWLRVLAPAGLVALGIALLIEVANGRPS